MQISNKKLIQNRQSQRGFSMIEVLISILVMSFGLLGIGGMMMTGVNNTTGSDLASRATQSASEIMDAMRANSNAARSNLYLWATWGGDTSTLSSSAPQDADRLQWLNTIRTLPGGDGTITQDATVPNGYIITVRYTNCLGTLNATQQSNCVNATVNSDKRTLVFRLKI
jgi:type IV pilus assembly protein PilV